jgi:hypothetical protein
VGGSGVAVLGFCGFFGVWFGSDVVSVSVFGLSGEFRIVLTLVLVGDSIGWFRSEPGRLLGSIGVSVGIMMKFEEGDWGLFIGFLIFSEPEFIGFDVG